MDETQRYPLLGCSVLIVDGVSLSAAELSQRLSALGAKVHVIPNAERAAALVRVKRLDIALIGHHVEDMPLALTKVLDEYGVPYIITATNFEHQSIGYEQFFRQILPVAPPSGKWSTRVSS